MLRYRQYGVKALAAKGKKAEAIRYAEGGRGRNDRPIALARAARDYADEQRATTPMSSARLRR